MKCQRKLGTTSKNAPLPPWLIEENVPALVRPVRFGETFAPAAFVIIQLNTDELAHHILPEIAQRYLSTNGRLDYQIALINANVHPSVVYTSDTGFGSSEHHVPDAQLHVFGQ